MEQRSRGGRSNRRKTAPSSSFQSDTSAGGDSNSSVMTRSPPAAASRTPQTVPPKRRGAGRPIPMNNPFSRSSPSTAVNNASPGKPLSRDRRSRTGGFEGGADEEDETYRKGPHTLRKRTKIDYSAADFEDELPEIAIPAPRTATRKRRADSEVADEDYFTPASQKRRATSRDFSVSSLPAARRRTPARKSVVEQQPFYSQPSDEDIVKDTIEVIGDSSDLVSSDDASDHEEDENDVPVHIGHPENRDQPSSPTQRKTQEAHQLATPVEQQIIKQDEKEPTQAEDVPVPGVVAAEDMNSGPVMAHPQPIRVNQVAIINNTGPATETQPPPTQRDEAIEEFQFQPKREASSPVRPTETSLQKAVLPEAAESVAEQQVVLGSQENSAPAPVITDNFTTSPDTTAVTTGEAAVAPEPVEQLPEPVIEQAVNGEITNGHVEATEDKLPPPQLHQSPEPIIAPDEVKVYSFTVQPEEAPAAEDRMEVDPPEEDAHQETETGKQEHVPEDVEEDVHAEEPDVAPDEPEEPEEVPVEPEVIEPEVYKPEVIEPEVIEPEAYKPEVYKPEVIEPEVYKPIYAWSHLTPYMDGEHVTHSIYPVTVEGPAPTSNPDGPDVNGEAENAEESAEQADANAEGQQPDGEGDEDANADAEGEVEDADRDADHEEEHPPDSQGHQLSQESAYNSEAPTPALTPRQGSPALPSAAATGTNTPAPPVPTQRFRKQYKFKKLRDPADFMEFLKDTKNLSYEELWDLLAQVNTSLVAWQDEFKECTKVVDDQENAQRRAVQDAAFEKKTADLNAFAKVESYIEKDFDVQGYRATIKEKDAGVLEQRWQDRVMASAFGFEYDPHPNKVGNQDPDAQRDGGGEGRQLRNQPQASAKAAEGDGVIVSGKRTRNPPKLFDGVLQDDHRSATPGGNKPGPKRRGRAAAADKASANAIHDEPEDEPEPQNISPAKGGPRKRGPRGKRAVIAESEPNTPAPEQDAIAPPPPEPEQAQAPPKRKRGRQPKVAPVEEFQPEERTPKRGRGAKRQSNGHVAVAPDTTDESRPTSSSSNATISDDGSTYGLRQNKRQRNWREEADVDEEAMEAMQPTKRPRIRLNRKQSAPELAPKQTTSERILTEIRDFSAPATPDAPQLMISFKLVGKDHWTVKNASTPRQTSTDVSEYNAPTPRPAPVSAPTSAKSSAPPSQAGEEKDYSTMTKSEKMSASMKKRWLNGSMQGAVNKRKATLAAKKAAAAAAEAAQAQQAQAQQKAMQQFQQQQVGILPLGPNQ